MTQDTTINSESKVRRLTYYDLDKQRTRTRRFSQIEIQHANQVFDTIEDILLENDLAIRNGGQNKWVGSGSCECDEHDDSYFMVEVEGDIIDVDVIHEIEEALEVLHAKSVYIISRHERNHDFLELVAIQKFSTNDKTENNFLESDKE